MRSASCVVLGLSALAGCTASPTVRTPPPLGRAVLAAEATAPVGTTAESPTPPTVDQMKEAAPETLTREQAAEKLVRVRPDQVQMPVTRIGTVPLATLPSIHGVYPFSYMGLNYYAPYYWNAGLGVYSALYSWPHATMYPHALSSLSYASTLGCYVPSVPGNVII